MVLDPLTALSLAGNVIQFVDFGLKIFSRTKELYYSTSGRLNVHEQLHLVTVDISRSCELISRSMHLRNEPPAKDSEVDLQMLCRACNDIADKLLVKLRKLEGKKKVWKSFRDAMESVWNEDEMKDLSEGLSLIRDQIQMHVILNLREQIDSAFLHQSKRFDSLDEANKGILTALLNTQRGVAETVEEFKKTLQKQTLAITQLLSPYYLSLDYKTGSTTKPDQDEPLPKDKPLGLWTSNREKYVRLQTSWRILNDLRFPSMTARENQIQNAYATTYQWIFDDQRDITEEHPQTWSSFAEWLKSGFGVYWVNGKAASGKSTLMRYISYHQQTELLLKEWGGSGSLGLHISRFYFWNSGTPEQRSQDGLLRSLLFDCLVREPELIPIILPTVWARYYSDLVREVYVQGVDENPERQACGSWQDLLRIGPSWRDKKFDGNRWTLTALMDAFTAVIEQSTIPTKRCLFIDGLDEFEGDHTDIAELFQKISKIATGASPFIKICVSSRPLLPFQDAFKMAPSLRLQDLTQKDITSYVASNFHKNSYFQRFAEEDPVQASVLVQDIVSIADGVFLWVTLVVSSLLLGLRNRDDISDLRRRINMLPRDLETLFAAMFSQIDDFYKESASKVFQIVRWAQEVTETLDLITLSLSLDSDPELAITTEFKDLTYEEIGKKCRWMEDRLKVLSLGLLEVNKLGCPGNHRGSHTCGPVQYLHRTVRDYLETPTVKAFLLLQTNGTNFDANTSLLCGYIRREKGNVDHAYVNRIFRTTEPFVVFIKSGRPDHRLLNELFRVGADVVAGDLLEIYMNSRDLKLGRTLSVEVVATLLKHGATPNHGIRGQTPWVHALLDSNFLSKRDNIGKQEISWLSTYAETLKLFLENDADVNVVCRIRAGSKPALWITKDTFADCLPEIIPVLDGMFKAGRAKIKVRGTKMENSIFRRCKRWLGPP